MKHSWTKQELQIVCVCYKQNLPIDLALLLTNTTDATSMEMRYRNCLFLDKGRVEGSLSHASNALVEAWAEVNSLLPKRKQDDSIILVLILLSLFVQFVGFMLY